MSRSTGHDMASVSADREEPLWLRGSRLLAAGVVHGAACPLLVWAALLLWQEPRTPTGGLLMACVAIVVAAVCVVAALAQLVCGGRIAVGMVRAGLRR
ncbi:hypothetical protein [Virgisporangium aliadipatigenens]|nr:hypothetical protein [Virgisporangium aliadipatigenens]